MKYLILIIVKIAFKYILICHSILPIVLLLFVNFLDNGFSLSCSHKYIHPNPLSLKIMSCLEWESNKFLVELSLKQFYVSRPNVNVGFAAAVIL